MKSILAFLGIVVLLSCSRKELPVPIDGDTVFHFRGTIGTDSIDYTAGINHLFLYTGFYKDTQNLMSLLSYFAPDNCTQCEPYLSIEIKDTGSTASSNALAGTIYDVLHGGGNFYSFSLDSSVVITPVESFTFYPQINTSGALYQWNFGDGTTSTLASPTHTFSGGGVRNVRLTLQYGGSTDSIVNPILTDYNSVCRTQFNVMIDTMSANAVVVTALSSALNHSWDFGDGQTGTGITDTNIYSASGAYTITLNSGSPSCSTSFKRHIGFGFLPVSNASYTYTTALNSLSTYSPRINNSACIITWKNKGATYRSYKNDSKLNQQGNVVLTIDSFEAYTPDSKGNPTLKIKGRVNTWLYNEANKNDSVKIVSNDLIFALAYPN